MTLGNKTLRVGMDLAVAARVARLRHAVVAEAAPAEPLPEPVAMEAVAPPAPLHVEAAPEAAAPAPAPASEGVAFAPAAAGAPPPPPAAPTGSLARRIAARIYRLLKPVTRPVLFRVRNYMNQPVTAWLAHQDHALLQHKAEITAHQAVTTNALAARLAVIEARSAAIEANLAAATAALVAQAEAEASSSTSAPARWRALEQMAASWEAMAPALQSLGARQDGLAAAILDVSARIQRVDESVQLAALRTERLQRIESFAEGLAAQIPRLERIESLADGVFAQIPRLERIEGLADGVFAQVPRLERIEGAAEAAAAQVPRLERIETASQDVLDRSTRIEQVAAAHDPQRLQRIETYALHAAQRLAVPGSNGEIMVRTAVGYMLCAASDHALLASLLESGELEPGTRLLIQRLLRPGDTFVDVGANIGMHTVAAARAMQGQGRVVAFEPYEPTARLLAGSLWLNGLSQLVELHQAAVSNAPGTQALHIGNTSGHHSLFGLDDALVAERTVDVPVVRLDDVLPPGTLVQLLKIDVEGAELDVVEGARDLVRANPSAALIVEYGRSHLRRTGHATADWLRPFRELGLEFKLIDAQTGRLTACSERDLDREEAANLLFARPDAAAWARAEAPE